LNQGAEPAVAEKLWKRDATSVIRRGTNTWCTATVAGVTYSGRQRRTEKGKAVMPNE
jgi:hypothetical protein